VRLETQTYLGAVEPLPLVDVLSLKGTRGGSNRHRPLTSQGPCRHVRGLAHLLAPWLVIAEDAPAGTLEVLELTAVERPKERREAE
jgi:hypothetical protein